MVVSEGNTSFDGAIGRRSHGIAKIPQDCAMLPLLLALSTIVFVAFAWAIRRHFVSDSPNPKMRILAVLGVMTFAVYVEQILLSPHPLWRAYLVGAALHVLSLYIFSTAVMATRERKLHIAFSEAPCDFIVTSGPYAYLRHPFYVSYAIFWLGCTIETLSLACAVLALVLCGFYVGAARKEEARFLRSPAAEAYRDYQAKAGLFWPRLHLGRSQ
jgi:protein-S-isoprenylcysteine O-methyltransferase Ste14